MTLGSAILDLHPAIKFLLGHLVIPGWPFVIIPGFVRIKALLRKHRTTRLLFRLDSDIDVDNPPPPSPHEVEPHTCPGCLEIVMKKCDGCRTIKPDANFRQLKKNLDADPVWAYRQLARTALAVPTDRFLAMLDGAMLRLKDGRTVSIVFDDGQVKPPPASPAADEPTPKPPQPATPERVPVTVAPATNGNGNGHAHVGAPTPKKPIPDRFKKGARAGRLRGNEGPPKPLDQLDISPSAPPTDTDAPVRESHATRDDPGA